MKFEHFVTWRRIIIWFFEEIWISGDFLCFMTEHGRNSRDTKSDLFYIRSISVCLLSCDLTWYMDCLRHHNHLLDHCQMRLLSSCRMLLNFFHLNKFTSAKLLALPIYAIEFYWRPVLIRTFPFYTNGGDWAYMCSCLSYVDPEVIYITGFMIWLTAI